MTTFIISGLVLVFAIAIIAYVYYRQIAEQKRIERARRIMMLGDKARRLQYLMDEIPNHYLEQSLKVFIGQQIVGLLQEQAELEPNNPKISDNLNAAQEQLAKYESNKHVAVVPITDLQTANGVRRSLKDLHHHIVSLYQNKKISHRAAQDYLKKIRAAFNLTIMEVYGEAAKRARQENKPRIAILHYKRIISELSKQNASGEYTAKIEEISNLVDELENEVARQENNAPSSDENQLSKELEQMLEEEETWKKKQLYD